MYCVLCGTPLDDWNQIGLICTACRPEPEERGKNADSVIQASKRFKKEPIQVSYCSACGKPFHPKDAAIRHWACIAWPALEERAVTR